MTERPLWGSLFEELRKVEFRPPPVFSSTPGTGGGDDDSETDVVEWSVTAPEDAPVRVSNVDGPVSVGPADGPDVAVRAEKRVTGRSRPPSDAQVRVERRDGALTVDVEYADGDPDGIEVALDVEVPPGAPVDAVETVNGRVDVAGVAGDARVESTNGPVSVRDVSGTLSLRTVDGPITAEGVGAVRDAETTNGPIDLDLTRLDGDATVATTSGSVTIGLPADERPRLDLSPGLGSVTVEGIPEADDGEGRPTLRVSTTTGSITVVGT
jgi:hypothetical protein